jgi:hypothetical protein
MMPDTALSLPSLHPGKVGDHVADRRRQAGTRKLGFIRFFVVQCRHQSLHLTSPPPHSRDDKAAVTNREKFWIVMK